MLWHNVTAEPKSTWELTEEFGQHEILKWNNRNNEHMGGIFKGKQQQMQDPLQDQNN